MATTTTIGAARDALVAALNTGDLTGNVHYAWPGPEIAKGHLELVWIVPFVGILMYLQARQRSQAMSYGLSRRMGLGDRQYRGSLVMELAVMLLSMR
jgi:hypothetical protein